MSACVRAYCLYVCVYARVRVYVRVYARVREFAYMSVLVSVQLVGVSV